MAIDMQTPQMNNPTTPSPVSNGPSSKGKNVAIVAIVVLVVAVVFVAIWFALRALSDEETTAPTAATTTETAPAVKDASDIQKLENQVRNTDVDSLEKDLDANDTDAAGF
jgi:flagellar basal body-associated protein FliL